MVKPIRDEQALELITRLKGFNYVSLNAQPPYFEVRLIDFATLQFDDKFEEHLHNLSHYWARDKGKLKKEFPNTSFHFLNELVRKSYKKEFENKFDPKKNKFRKECDPVNSRYIVADAPNKLSVFDLLRIAECYEHPAVEFPREETLDAFAEFETDPLRVVFNDMKSSKPICTQNKEPHSLAAYQDAADPFTHYLRLFKRGDDTTQQEAMIVESTTKNLKDNRLEDCLLVEGVYGTPSLEDQRDNYFYYMYKCLVHYAFKARIPLAFNTAFSDNSQIEPKLFLNYTCENHLGKRPVFVFNKKNERYELSKRTRLNNNYRIKAFNLNDNKDSITRLRKGIEEKLNGIFTNPSAVLDAFSNEKRYLDTTFFPRQRHEYESREYYFTHQFLRRHKGQWNKREGNAKLIYLNYEEVKAEHIRLFPEYHPEIHTNRDKKNTRKTIAKIFAGFVLFAILASGLAYSYHKKETQFDKMKENAITNVVNKVCPDCTSDKKRAVRSRILLLNQQPIKEEVEARDIVDNTAIANYRCGYMTDNSDDCGEAQYHANWDVSDEAIEGVKKGLSQFCVNGGIKDKEGDPYNMGQPYCENPICKTYLNGIGCTEYDMKDFFYNLDFRRIKSMRLAKNIFNNFTFNHSLILDYKDMEFSEVNPWLGGEWAPIRLDSYGFTSLLKRIIATKEPNKQFSLDEISEGKLSMYTARGWKDKVEPKDIYFVISSNGISRADLSCERVKELLLPCINNNKYKNAPYLCDMYNHNKICDQFIKSPKGVMQLFKWKNINTEVILKDSPLHDFQYLDPLVRDLFSSLKIYLDMHFYN